MPRKSNDILQILHDSIPELSIQTNISWKEITTIGIGGTIPLLAVPRDKSNLQTLLKLCHRESIPVFILGAGSNVIGSDTPLDILVVKLTKDTFSILEADGNIVSAGAANKLVELVRYAAEHGLGGIAPLAGIPGTVGGALRMNAGAHGVTVGDHVMTIHGLDSRGNTWETDASALDWTYRRVSIPEDIIITDAEFQLPESDPESEQNTIDATLSKRKARTPKGRSAGSIFRNPSPDIPTGKLIDQAGCKNMRYGGIKVSEEHANYFINDNNATENDFISLVRKVKEKVHQHSKITISLEVVFANPASTALINA